jgi:hypothetical protein
LILSALAAERRVLISGGVGTLPYGSSNAFAGRRHLWTRALAARLPSILGHGLNSEVDACGRPHSPVRCRREPLSKVAEALKGYVRDFFLGDATRAAKDLGISKQRLNSYTSRTSFPPPEVFDRVRERWNLDLLSIGAVPNRPPEAPTPGASSARKLSLFDQPITLTNAGVKIVLERKGAAVAAEITVSRKLKTA